MLPSTHQQTKMQARTVSRAQVRNHENKQRKWCPNCFSVGRSSLFSPLMKFGQSWRGFIMCPLFHSSKERHGEAHRSDISRLLCKRHTSIFVWNISEGGLQRGREKVGGGKRETQRAKGRATIITYSPPFCSGCVSFSEEGQQAAPSSQESQDGGHCSQQRKWHGQQGAGRRRAASIWTSVSCRCGAQ